MNTLVALNTQATRDYSMAAGYPELQPLGLQDQLKLAIYNSIFAFNGPGSEPTGVYIGEGVEFIEDYNIWYSSPDAEIYLAKTGTYYSQEDISSGEWSNDTGNGAHSIVADPEFRCASRGDFHLRESSPAIDAGSCELAPSVDLEGNSRPKGAGCDIGPYEFSKVSLRLEAHVVGSRVEVSLALVSYMEVEVDGCLMLSAIADDRPAAFYIVYVTLDPYGSVQVELALPAGRYTMVAVFYSDSCLAASLLEWGERG